MEAFCAVHRGGGTSENEAPNPAGAHQDAAWN